MQARAPHREALAELPPYAVQLSRGYPAIPTVFEPDGAEPELRALSAAANGGRELEASG